jgi:hypothetical protein
VKRVKEYKMREEKGERGRTNERERVGEEENRRDRTNKNSHLTIIEKKERNN